MNKPRYLIFNEPAIGEKKYATFIPAITIHCNPPYIAGRVDGTWMRYKGVDATNKQQCEEAAGMRLLPITETRYRNISTTIQYKEQQI